MNIRGSAKWFGLILSLMFVSPIIADGAAPETTKLTIGSSKDVQLGAQLTIAKRKGWFKEEGLDVTVAYFTSGAEETAALAAGAIKIGSFGDSPTSNMMGAALPIKVIAAQAEITGTQHVVVRKGINKPEDLIGKKVGLTVGSGAEPLFLGFLNHYGVSSDKVKILNMRAPEQVAALARGDIDGLAVWQPHALRAKQKAGGHSIVSGTHSFIPGKEGPIDFYGAYSLLSVRDEFIKSSPNTILAILRALNRATKFLNDPKNLDEAAKLTEKDMGQSLGDLKVFLQENIYDMSINPKVVRTVTRTINFLHSKGKLKSKPNFDKFLHLRFLKEIDPSLIKYEPKM